MRKYSQACEENKKPILGVLSRVFQNCENVLEVGSGTGQHAAYFARHLSHLVWQPSDLPDNLPSIRAWIDDGLLDNVKLPIELDICRLPWPRLNMDAIFTANTFHIVSWETVECFFQAVSKGLDVQGIVVVYGPFSYYGKHISQSNADFDVYLKQRCSLSGVRDFVQTNELAIAQGFKLLEDIAMPVNNRCLVWQKG